MAAPHDTTSPGELASVGGYPLSPRWGRVIALVWTGQALSVLATYAATYAAIWYIVETFNSPLAVSFTSVASLLPIALLSPLGGVVADRFPRKRVMILADGLAGAASAVIAALIVLGDLHVGMLLAMLVVRACAQAFHAPALTATMPLMVPEKHLVRINSLDQMLTSGSAIVSPAIGIFLYTTFGFATVLVVDAVCALLACLCLAVARIPQPEIAPKTGTGQAGPLADMKDAARLLVGDRPLFWLLVVCAVAMLVFVPLGTLFPLITYDWYQGDGYAASLVEAVAGIGLLVGSVVLLIWGGGSRLVPVMMGSGLAIAALLIVVSALEQAPFAAFLVAAALIFVATGIFNGPIMPIMQKRLAQDQMGKAMGITIALSSWAAPIGLVITGIGATAIGIAPWFFVSGIVLAGFCVVGLASKALRVLDEPSVAASGEDAHRPETGV